MYANMCNLYKMDVSFRFKLYSLEIFFVKQSVGLCGLIDWMNMDRK